MIKRAFDVCVSLLGLVILSPVLLAVAVALWATIGRPVIFSQQRPGLQARPFTIHKFRTMTVAEPGNDDQRDAQRMTSTGNLLRSTSLDELPELFNVLRGDMSLVGPRPLLMEYLPLYSAEQARRHDVRPGITGWAQVKGRNALSWDEKFQLDVWYVDNRSFWLDLKILWLTIAKVIRREGISHPGESTMSRFKGNAS